ncbi:MAG: hypothetical protein QOH16_715 [Gaiellaceae bacterium]|nr:hypothetical protein [Gaiellaceae bacterium]
MQLDTGRLLVSRLRRATSESDLLIVVAEARSWTDRVAAYLRESWDSSVEQAFINRGRDPDRQIQWRTYRDRYAVALEQRIDWLRGMVLEPSTSLRDGPSSRVREMDEAAPPIFLVHGHDSARKDQVARFVERVTNREVIVLHEQPSRGLTIIEKFEAHGRAAGYAIALLTRDDLGRDGSGGPDLRSRARQNVVFELGFFVGVLGRSRVVVLIDPDVEKPSDISGLIYVTLADEWRSLLAREMAAAGLPVHAERL